MKNVGLDWCIKLWFFVNWFYRRPREQHPVGKVADQLPFRDLNEKRSMDCTVVLLPLEPRTGWEKTWRHSHGSRLSKVWIRARRNEPRFTFGRHGIDNCFRDYTLNTYLIIYCAKKSGYECVIVGCSGLCVTVRTSVPKWVFVDVPCTPMQEWTQRQQRRRLPPLGTR